MKRWPSVGCGTLICLAWIAPCCASESLAGLLACRSISNAASRLACFDREAALAAATPALPAIPARPAPVLDPQQQFGLSERAVAAKEVTAGTRASEAAKIEAHIAQLAQAPSGRAVFSLDNGQVWQQVSSEGDLLTKQGDAVTISRAALGSYWLQTKSGRGCRVSRVR